MDPVAVGAPLSPEHTLQSVLQSADDVRARLRRAIAAIERPALLAARQDKTPEPWRLGCAEGDALLPQGLDPAGVHEVKAGALAHGASAADWMTSIGFALRLAVCRLEALKSGREEQLLLVDVREPQEWAAGRLPGSVHIPLGSLAQRTGEIPADVTPVFICALGGRSMAACRFFAGQGRDAINLSGGVTAWSGVYGAPPRPDEQHRH